MEQMKLLNISTSDIENRHFALDGAGFFPDVEESLLPPVALAFIFWGITGTILKQLVQIIVY